MASSSSSVASGRLSPQLHTAHLETDSSWQAMLHRDWLADSQAYLAEKNPQTDEETQARDLGMTYLRDKILCKDVSLPTDPTTKAVFDRVVLVPIQERAINMGGTRQFTLDNNAPSYAMHQMISQKTAENVLDIATSAVMQKALEFDNKESTALRNEIQLLEAWAKEPSRIFTDKLGPI